MGFSGTRRPWYADGLAFSCTACGRCCSGPEPGYVWISREEILAAAQWLDMPASRFKRQYVRRVGVRLSLVEKPNADCIFLREQPDGRRTCEIYAVRPTQCRTWPFWNANLASPDTWALAGQRCPGVNRGALHELDHIERQRHRTG